MGTYQVEVTAPGAEPQTWTLPLADPEFRVFTWLGFIAGGDADGAFYLDSMKLQAVSAPRQPSRARQ